MPRQETEVDPEALDDTADEEGDTDDGHILPSAREQVEIKRYLQVYGDEEECRIVDTNPHVIARDPEAFGLELRENSSLAFE
jgi:hypothetical protein